MDKNKLIDTCVRNVLSEGWDYRVYNPSQLLDVVREYERSQNVIIIPFIHLEDCAVYLKFCHHRKEKHSG